jgi:hypothetical protein
MSTRSIVTSQPDVACDVCERRLLRGEQPDIFLAAGQPRTVCELCAPRAAHQGWKRGSEQHALNGRPLRSRRGRGLFERLRQARRPGSEEVLALGAESGQYDGAGVAFERDPYDFLDASAIAGEPTPAGLEDGAGARTVIAEEQLTPPANVGGPLHEAVTVFNAGEYTRRVASLARSLGAPEVTVRPGEAVASSVVIVLAWELCWYTYEVDLDDMQGAEARAIAQGTELSELPPQDRLANGLADARGTLTLV